MLQKIMIEIIHNNIKILLGLVILLFNINATFSFKSYDDSLINITITPDSTNGITNEGIITCNINNNGSDTIIMINEFYIHGLDASNVEIIPMASFYSPNIICLNSYQLPKIQGDGYFKINYYEFPSLL